jgi:hypothetical protein
VAIKDAWRFAASAGRVMIGRRGEMHDAALDQGRPGIGLLVAMRRTCVPLLLPPADAWGAGRSSPRLRYGRRV